MRTTATNKKVRELVSNIADGVLIPRPEFQRRLVWTNEDKNRFIETVLLGFPFPEVYVADGDVDLETARGTQILVDGQQRITTLHQYFSGDRSLALRLVAPYTDLTEEDQRKFLSYDVAVRDLGSISREQLIEVFRRINATNYALNEMEINNAVYEGALKKFVDRLANFDFFERNRIFSKSDIKRMGDLKFVLLLVTTMMYGYFNRDDEFEHALNENNDEFPMEREIEGRINAVIAVINECNFLPRSRLWKKADLFTFVIELDRALFVDNVNIDFADLVDRVERFFNNVNTIEDFQGDDVVQIYYKASLQATNDRLNRVRRGVIMHALIMGKDAQQAYDEFIAF
jgi:hypothetical protein